MVGCRARQYNDQMICGPCGLQWDTGDLDPPACKDPPDVPAYVPSRRRRTAAVLHWRSDPQPGLQPRRLVWLDLVVRGEPVGRLCAPLDDTARGRMDLWEWASRLRLGR